MKHAQDDELHVKVSSSRTNEGCDVLSLRGVDQLGQHWEHVVMRCRPIRLAIEPNSSERVYRHTSHRIRSAG